MAELKRCPECGGVATVEAVAMALEQFGKVRVVMVTDGRGK